MRNILLALLVVVLLASACGGAITSTPEPTATPAVEPLSAGAGVGRPPL